MTRVMRPRPTSSPIVVLWDPPEAQETGRMLWGSWVGSKSFSMTA